MITYNKEIRLLSGEILSNVARLHLNIAGFQNILSEHQDEKYQEMSHIIFAYEIELKHIQEDVDKLQEILYSEKEII